jgi:F420-non-reducing hydrogenase iron-sulfur subunit
MSADLEMQSTAHTVQSEAVHGTASQNEPWDPADEERPKVIAFLCNWCSYAGADLAGISRIQYPPNVRVVRVPCSGRVNPLYIIKALQHGADGVLVSGCHPGDCHYISGNYYARRRFTLLKSLLEAVGIEPGRVNFSWVSAAEGEKFSQVVTQVVETVKALGPAKRLVKVAPDRQRTLRALTNGESGVSDDGRQTSRVGVRN